MKRTDNTVEQRIVTLIALGHPYADISVETGVAVPTIKKIRKRSQERLERVEARVVEKHVDEVSAILQQTYRQIHCLLDSDEQGLIELSIRDLLAISKEMYKQTAISPLRGTRPQILERVYKKYL